MAILSLEDFAPHVHSTFLMLGQSDTTLPLTLVEALPVGNGVAGAFRAPFSLVFLAADPAVIPQAMYALRHPAMGELTLFLVPIAKDAEGVRYEAAFS